MNWENIDPQMVQLLSQLISLERQLVGYPPKDLSCDKFMAGLIDFINVVGNEMQKQAL